MLSGRICRLPLPEEHEVLFSHGSRVWQSGFLEGDDVHLQSGQLLIDDCSLSSIANVLKIVC